MSITLPGVPEGYEDVRFGRPKNGESLLNTRGDVEVATSDWVGGHRLIVRKIWTPPEWLKPGWIFLNCDEWFWTSGKVVRCGDPSSGYKTNDYSLVNLSYSTNFIGPDVSPENSLIEIAGDQ